MLGDHSVSGYLKSATFHDLFGSLTTGGTANQKTTLKGKTFELDLTMTSKLNSLTGKDFFGSINAPTIGKIVMQKSTNRTATSRPICCWMPVAARPRASSP